MPQRKQARRFESIQARSVLRDPAPESRQYLEVVLKCDSVGSVEAVSMVLNRIRNPDVGIKIIHAGVGPVSKSDLVMAMTGSKLVVGFNVKLMPKLERWVKENGVDVKLYSVIYRLLEDLQRIAQSLIPREVEEKITGRAEIIAVFKTKNGTIIGCEVKEGLLTPGKNFRIISAMGPVHAGRIESLEIEKRAAKEARPGQQVGIRVSGFEKAKVGDLIECYEMPASRRGATWTPTGSVVAQ